MTPLKTTKTVMAGLLLLLAAGVISSCSEENLDHDNGVTVQGTVDLGTIKLGTPDQIFQEAAVTFVRDLSASANSGGKRQYLSRSQMQGGQYMVQIKDGSCFEIMIIYKDNPVSREVAEAAMKKLLPEGAPPQSRVDEANANLDAVYYFGDDYLGDLSFTDKSQGLVKSVKVSNISLLKHAQADSEAQKESLKPLVEKEKQDPGTAGN